MRRLTLLVPIASMLLALPCLAQPGGDEPALTPATPPQALPARPLQPLPELRETRKQRERRMHEHLMATSPEYRSGRSMMIGGIVITSVGGGLGMLSTVIGLAGMMAFGLSYGQTDAGPFPYFLAGGLVTIVVSVAVGLPVLFVGRAKKNRERQRYRRMGFSAGPIPGGGMAGLTWRF